MRDLETPSAELDRIVDDLRQVLDVLAVDRRIDVSGKPSSFTQRATSRFLAEPPLYWAMRSAFSGSTSWIESWTWSRPASASLPRRSRVSSTPAVMRFE